MKEIPKIEKYMTAMPHSVNPELPLKTARDMLKKHGFRHLPVQEGGHLVGVITDRDVKLAESFGDTEKLTIADVMTADPYAVAPGTPLDEVLESMVEHKYGCAVVRQENGKVVGIFTATDGLRAFTEVLHARFKRPTSAGGGAY